MIHIQYTTPFEIKLQQCLIIVFSPSIMNYPYVNTDLESSLCAAYYGSKEKAKFLINFYEITIFPKLTVFFWM
jgi:hypothetical protein